MITLKSTGIVRKVDELGRIVLPIELRRTLDIAEKDSLEIYMDGPSIILKKYQPACIFCDDAGMSSFSAARISAPSASRHSRSADSSDLIPQQPR